MQLDIFNEKMMPFWVLHKETDTPIIVISVKWYKGKQEFKCLVPCFEEKKTYFATAIYSESDILFYNEMQTNNL